MRRSLFALLLAFVLLVSSASAVAQPGQPDERPGNAPEERPGSDDARPDEDESQEKEADSEEKESDSDGDEGDDRSPSRGRSGHAPTERRPGHGDAPLGRGPPAHVGTFQLDPRGHSAQGDYVSFLYNDTSVRNFTAGGVQLFDLSVDAEDAEGRQSRIASHGAQLRLQTGHLEFVSHDNPTAPTRVSADGNLVLKFVEGANLTLLGDERARFEVGSLTGTVRGERLQLEGATLTVQDRLLVFLDEPRGAFDVHRSDISRAIAKGSVGAEATFNQLEDSVQQDVVSYGNVTMTTLKAEKGNITLLVEGHGLEGRVLILNVDRRIVEASQGDDLTIVVDNTTIRQAESLIDILNPDDDGFHPEYYVVFDPTIEAFQLIVTLPHYSVHTLSVTSIIPLPPPSVVVGIVAGVLVLAPSGYVLFRRRE